MFSMKSVRIIASLTVLMIWSEIVIAQSYESHWPEEEPMITSAIMSRTSISVRSIEESLILYRDILGMTPFYERTELRDSRLPAFSGLTANQYMNLTVLRTETDGADKINAGYIGLAEIREANGSLAKVPEPSDSVSTIGSMAILIVVEDVRSVYEKVVKAGYEVISAPKLRGNESYSQLLIRGPNHERLWITQGELRTPFIRKIAQQDSDETEVVID